MGHVYAGILILIFVAIIAGKPYFSYLYAVKHTSQEQSLIPEIPVEGLRFTYNIKGAVIFGVMALVIPAVFIIGLIKCYKPSDPESMGVFWMVFDLSFPASLILTLAAIKGFRSYLHFFPEWFEYREDFRVKKYPNERIEGVYRTSDFIFVCIKGKRLPVIIENGYGDSNLIFGLLLTFAAQGKDY